MEVTLDKISYYPNDELIIKVKLTEKERLFLESYTLINLTIFKIETKRNKFSIKLSANIDSLINDIVIFKYKIPSIPNYGIYYIENLILINPISNVKKVFTVNNGTLNIEYFHLAVILENPYNQELLKKEINKLDIERKKFIEMAITINNSTINSKNFKVYIFAVGCKIHNFQEMGFYCMYPLNKGFSYDHMLNITNETLIKREKLEVNYLEETEKRFSDSTPIFVIEYKKIYANNIEEVKKFCLNHSNGIFEVLSFNQGQKPKHFASFIIDEEKEITQEFHFPGYYGNLVSPFCNTYIAEKIEELSPIMKQKPIVELLIKNYNDANHEQNMDFRYFKYWSILETLADKLVENGKYIFYPDGTHIKGEDNRGNEINIKTKYALSKVYFLLFNSNLTNYTHTENNFQIIYEKSTIYNSNNTIGQYKVIKLWDMLKGFYKIRNKVAHLGRFDYQEMLNGNDSEKEAAILYGYPSPLLMHLDSLVKDVIEKNIKNL